MVSESIELKLKLFNIVFLSISFFLQLSNFLLLYSVLSQSFNFFPFRINLQQPNKMNVYFITFLFSSFFPAPNFVSSLTQGDFVYFFFRETAVEYINCGKVSLIYQFFLSE